MQINKKKRKLISMANAIYRKKYWIYFKENLNIYKNNKGMVIIKKKIYIYLYIYHCFFNKNNKILFMNLYQPTNCFQIYNNCLNIKNCKMN